MAPWGRGHECMNERRADSAEYISELASEPSELARKEGLDTLAYLLEMTTLEAQSARKQANDQQRR